MLVDMATPKWSIFLVNDAWQQVTGISQELAVGSHFWDLFEPPLPAQVRVTHVCRLPQAANGRQRHSLMSVRFVCFLAHDACGLSLPGAAGVCAEAVWFVRTLVAAGASVQAGDRAAPQL